ncbi:hypothetical protein HC251_11435 [Iamia sp. SCSIO 61187]|uniref:Ykof family thiamine-binding protein n=1 Tax=Iamia sp. SCSIO 61187 TaxID=2722752 RepID=UPI001C6298C2|nr:Ykof family thiamine-binding protein [Iamia sp. SCSIO 61187]QYG92983.1 hypothetical protein HC251_11435 [Iamia sp. SCSIO 61187]
MATTIKLSVETRDRIKAMGGETYEDTIIEALDALDKQRFWAEADAYAAWLRSLPAEEQARIQEAERQESAALDRAFDGLG